MIAPKIDFITLKKTASYFNKRVITSSLEAYNFCLEFYSDDIDIYESFFLLLLSQSGLTIGYAKISQGGSVGTVVDIKILVKYALDGLASRVITCHNHPSGNIRPSDKDREMHDKIKNALSLFDIKVEDCLIIAKGNYYSFADQEEL